MQMTFWKSYWERNTFFLGRQIRQIKEGSLIDVKNRDWGKAYFPLVIVGREHYQESRKHFPVFQSSELDKIIKNLMDTPSLYFPDSKDDSGTWVRIWSLSKTASELIKDKICLWLPESLLLESAVSQSCKIATRDGQQLYFAENGGVFVSSLAKGLYINPEYFLMATGMAMDTPVSAMNEKEYLADLQGHWSGLGWSRWIQVLRQQGYLTKLSKMASWKSILVGSAASLLVLLLAKAGYVHWQSYYLDEQLAATNIKPVMQLKKLAQEKSELITALGSASHGGGDVERAWQLMASLMEANVQVLRVNASGAKIEIRLQAKQATEALQLISELPFVKSAEFSTSVMESLGNKRFTIAVVLKSSESGDN